jgi:hypothetical protein
LEIDVNIDGEDPIYSEVTPKAMIAYVESQGFVYVRTNTLGRVYGHRSVKWGKDLFDLAVPTRDMDS